MSTQTQPAVECRLDGMVRPLVERMADASRGRHEWRVANPESGDYCIAFGRESSTDPERDAREWLRDHRERFPSGRFAGYEVVCVIVQTEEQRMLGLAEGEIRLLARELGEACELLAGLRRVLEIATTGKTGERFLYLEARDGTMVHVHRAIADAMERQERLAALAEHALEA